MHRNEEEDEGQAEDERQTEQLTLVTFFAAMKWSFLYTFIGRLENGKYIILQCKNFKAREKTIIY